MAGKCVVLGMLVFFTREDIYEKKLTAAMFPVFGFAGLLLAVVGQTRSLRDLLGGISVGVLLLAISGISKGGVGAGDGILFCVTGIFLGFWKNMALLMTSLLFAAVYAVLLLAVRRYGRKSTFPFMPFVLAAYLLMLAV